LDEYYRVILDGIILMVILDSYEMAKEVINQVKPLQYLLLSSL
jgi:hypothetical protein